MNGHEFSYSGTYSLGVKEIQCKLKLAKEEHEDTKEWVLDITGKATAYQSGYEIAISSKMMNLSLQFDTRKGLVKKLEDKAPVPE